MRQERLRTTALLHQRQLRAWSAKFAWYSFLSEILETTSHRSSIPTVHWIAVQKSRSVPNLSITSCQYMVSKYRYQFWQGLFRWDNSITKFPLAHHNNPEILSIWQVWVLPQFAWSLSSLLLQSRRTQYFHFTRESIPALTSTCFHTSDHMLPHLWSFYTLSNCSTQTLHTHKNDLLTVAELLRQIRACSLRFNLLEWASDSKSLHDENQRLLLTSALHWQEIYSLYSGHISALMFCAFLLRNSQ